MSDPTTIPAVTLDTRSMPPSEQFSSWSRHSRNSRLTPLNEGGFRAQGTLWMLGPVHLSDIFLDPFVSERDQALVNATPAEHVQLVALHQGSVHLEAPGLDQLVTAPNLFMRDFARPSRATAGRIHCTTVYFARSFLEEATGPLSMQGQLAATPEAAVLRATLATLVQHLPVADAASAGLYARTLRDLFAAAWMRRDGAGFTSGAVDRLRRAKAYIAARPPGSVTVDDVSDALGLSRSVLYELFRPVGGVMAYDRLRRLRALYRDLCDTTKYGSIAELGAAHGFLDKATLSRSFRKTFGCSLKEVRLRSRRETAAPGASMVADTVRSAIGSLG